MSDNNWAKIAKAYNAIKGDADHELFWWKYSEECGKALNELSKSSCFAAIAARWPAAQRAMADGPSILTDVSYGNPHSD